MRALLKSAMQRFGLRVVRDNSGEQLLESISDLSESERQVLLRVLPYTMTSVERVASLINAVNYLAVNRIPGDIVECGVWRGGSMMATALTLLKHGDTSRSLFLYDTFEGMPAPTDQDKRWDGTPAAVQRDEVLRSGQNWCHASFDDVQENIFSTGYPREKIFLIKGLVEQTIPRTLPGPTALLRLDTDWYESTKHELVHLFPLLAPKGILILDDYGFWQGARRAVDEYFDGKFIYLHRIDNTGRLLVKAGP